MLEGLGTDFAKVLGIDHDRQELNDTSVGGFRVSAGGRVQAQQGDRAASA